jgi:aspartyl-tRNA(Asn)/glutamyl-tRNA(Gln) amidotransferase subunit B
MPLAKQCSAFMPVIGLEVHAQLQLPQSKLFSRAPGASHGRAAPPNAAAAAFDVALPGTYPMLNRAAVEQAIRTAVALKADVSRRSVFERKHYYYYDLPMGYQITQQRRPLATGGHVYLPLSGRHMRLARVQLEQDSGRTTHAGDRATTLADPGEKPSRVDLNRAGVALVELVFEPDLRSPEEAGDALRSLISLLRHIGVCDGHMESGSIRADLNVSLVPRETDGDDDLRSGQRVEIKNMNSVRHLVQAAAYEVRRQAAVLSASACDGGGVVESETRGFDPKLRVTYRQRSKADAYDYRFFPEPDLGVVRVTAEEVERLASTLPELPDDTIERLTRLRSQSAVVVRDTEAEQHRDNLALRSYALGDYDARVLVAEPGAVALFEETLRARQAEVPGYMLDPKLVANWIANDLFCAIRDYDLDHIQNVPIAAEHFRELLYLVQEAHISTATAKKVLAAMIEEGIHFWAEQVSRLNEAGVAKNSNQIDWSTLLVTHIQRPSTVS